MFVIMKGGVYTLPTREWTSIIPGLVDHILKDPSVKSVQSMSIKGPDDIGFSKSTFFAGSLAVFGGSLLFGVYRVMKKEDAKISIKTHKPEVMLAFKALAYGTALCIGAFAAAGATFSYTTKVTTLKEFDVWARKVGMIVPVPKVIEDAQSKAEADEFEQELNRMVESVVNGTSASDEANEPAK